MAKHTPGPWTADYTNEHSSSVCRINTRGFEHGNIATVYCADPAIEDEKEQAANAQLIAAAPDLLGALHAALQTARFERHPFRGWHKEAEDAIEKATGERP